MPAPILVASGAATYGFSRRAEARKKAAAGNQYAQKYPLLMDGGAMNASVKAAEAELRTIKSLPATTAAQRRVKNRNTNALTNWIVVMKDHNKDLQSGLPVAPSAPVMQNQPPASLPSQAAPVTPPQEQGSSVETGAPDAQNLAAPTVKKGVNWLLIGGVAVAGYFVYKMLKK